MDGCSIDVIRWGRWIFQVKTIEESIKCFFILCFNGRLYRKKKKKREEEEERWTQRRQHSAFHPHIGICLPVLMLLSVSKLWFRCRQLFLIFGYLLLLILGGEMAVCFATLPLIDGLFWLLHSSQRPKRRCIVLVPRPFTRWIIVFIAHLKNELCWGDPELHFRLFIHSAALDFIRLTEEDSVVPWTDIAFHSARYFCWF